MKGIQIERNFTQFVVFAEDTILSALSKITANQSRLIFVVSESGILQGVLSPMAISVAGLPVAVTSI